MSAGHMLILAAIVLGSSCITATASQEGALFSKGYLS